jgi:hypothetical protein
MPNGHLVPRPHGNVTLPATPRLPIERILRAIQKRTPKRSPNRNRRARPKVNAVKEMTGHIAGTVSKYREYHKGRKLGKACMKNLAQPSYLNGNASAHISSAIGSAAYSIVAFMYDKTNI